MELHDLTDYMMMLCYAPNTTRNLLDIYAREIGITDFKLYKTKLKLWNEIQYRWHVYLFENMASYETHPQWKNTNTLETVKKITNDWVIENNY